MIHRSMAYILLRSCNFVLAGPVTTQVPLSASLLSDVDHQVHHPQLQHSPLRPWPPFSLGSAVLAIVASATIAHTHTKTISKFPVSFSLPFLPYQLSSAHLSQQHSSISLLTRLLADN